MASKSACESAAGQLFWTYLLSYALEMVHEVTSLPRLKNAGCVCARNSGCVSSGSSSKKALTLAP